MHKENVRLKARVVLLAGSVLALGVIGLMGYYLTPWHARRPGRGMMTPFTQVDKFKRVDQYAESLLEWTPHAYVAFASRGKWFAHDSGDKRATNSMVYICDPDKVMRYSLKGTLVNMTTLEDMGLDPNSYELFRLVGASDDRVFVTYMEYIGTRGTTGTRRLCHSIVEILYADGTSVVTHHETTEQPNCVTVWPEKRLLLSLMDVRVGVKVIDLDSRMWINTAPIPVALKDADVDTVQWVYGLGALFSSSSWYSPPMTEVIMVWPDQGRSRVIDNGKSAVLAADGFIYYLKGDTQVWRCKPDGEPQLVYEGTKNPVVVENSGELILGRGGDFIAFHCADPRLRYQRLKDIVVIDLISGEYMPATLTTWLSPGVRQ